MILAGVAVGLGLGVKLTTALVLPVIVLLAIRLGRRRALGFAMATGVTFAALGAWSFVLNLVETGHVLGHGGGRVEQTASPSLSGGLTTGRKVLLHLIDRSGFEVHVIEVLVLVALCGVAALVTILRHRGRSWGSAFTTAGVFALSLLAPIFVAGLAVLNKRQPSPVHLGSLARINERVNEDVSSFGPLGLVLIGVCVLTMGATLKRRSDAACRLILALALPLFLVILALTSRYNPWLSRFLIVPALAAPLFGPLFSRRSMTLGIVVVAATTLGLALVRNELKPLDGSTARPWKLTRVEAVKLQAWKPQAGRALEQLDALVSQEACVGAVLDTDEPSYVLFGARLERYVTFLPRENTPQAAERAGVPYVVIGSGNVASLADGFRAGGWALRTLGSGSTERYWTLAISPRGGSGHCQSSTAVEQAKTLAPA